jgi:TonB family protein
MKRAASPGLAASWNDRRPVRGALLAVGFATLASLACAADAAVRVLPRAISRPPPTYPENLYHAGVEGDADIVFDVDERGSATNVIVRSASRPEFGEAAAEAVLKWQFEPGQREGKPSRFRVTVPFNFRMKTMDPLSEWAGRNVFRTVENQPIQAETLEEWPQPARWIYPPYPNQLRGSGKKGQVVVRFVVDEFGQVINPEVLQGDEPLFVGSALAAAVSLRFSPHLTPEGDAVPVQMAVIFSFDEKRQKMWDRALTQKKIR